LERRAVPPLWAGAADR